MEREPIESSVVPIGIESFTTSGTREDPFRSGDSEGDKKRVCVVGAGPSGMSALYHFAQMAGAGVPEVVCYEKQATWSGMWNYTWRTGTDEHGELCHGAMYRHLWSNAPKECLEYPDYTFLQHFGKAIPSYPPRKVLRDYLEGRWKSCNKDLNDSIHFNTSVKQVSYDMKSDQFAVRIRNLKDDTEKTETFTHVIVAVGIFNAPGVPDFPGLDEFPGRVMHAHNFRNAREFRGQRLLLVGASFSAEDLALQCKKFGAGHIICTWRTNPMGYKFPEGIEERPLLQRVDGNTVFFKDGSSAEVDSIILCTGYLYSYPFLSDDLRLKSRRSYYPDNLYKGIVFTKGGNNKLLYVGAKDQCFSYTMFDVEAAWACKYIAGDIKLPTNDEEIKADIKKWIEKLAGIKDCDEAIDFQADFLDDLAEAAGYDKRISDARVFFHEWKRSKDEDIATYRDKAYVSLFTDTKATTLKDTWMKIFDDSIEYCVQ